MQPFDDYPLQGGSPLGPLKMGDGTARHGYGLDVALTTGFYKCAYCKRDLLATYEAWLDLSVDHVVPQSTKWESAAKEWINDKANMVICCRACNEFTNKHEIKEREPKEFVEFVKIRDNTFLAKKERVLVRHNAERQLYEQKWLALK